MASMKLTTRQQVEDFVRGCAFYGTGGGGLPVNGVASLMSELEAGHEIGWVDLSELPGDALAVCPFLMGSIAPHDAKTKAEMAGYGYEEKGIPEKDRLAKAVQELEAYTGKKFGVIVPIELGGANTPGPIGVAASLGMLAVDGDYTSRAIPEIVQTTPYYNGMVPLPIASVDEFGNTCIIKHARNARVAEMLGKLISCAGYGLAGQASYVVDMPTLKNILIPGTLTECYELGRAMREAKEQGGSAVAAAVDYTKGYLLGQGKIVSKKDYDDAGYYWGTTEIECEEGYVLKYWFKNENHVVWKDEQPFVTSPDIISAVDLDTGEPVPNPTSYVGQRVALLGVPCKPQLETPECHSVLAPRYFGFDIDHTPIRELMKEG